MAVTKFQKGLQGQQEAEKFLQANGYTILERNYRTRTGEIDIIARHGTYTVFVEVKLRHGLEHGHPCEAVGAAKQQKIIKTALHYISVMQLGDCDFRFDVVEVLVQNGQAYARHIVDAFGV